MKVLMVTRKYPPMVGGMENFCYNLFSRIEKREDIEGKIVSLGKSQIHLLWFFPYALLYVLFNARKYDAILVGDGLMCMCGAIAKLVNPKMKRVIILYGLDVTYSNPLYQLYLKMFLKNCCHEYVCISQYTYNVATNWGITKEKLVITPGINTTLYKGEVKTDKEAFRAKYKIPQDDLIVITVGRLVKRKGQEWFVRNVMPSLKNTTYLIVGGGDEKENIEAAIKECQLGDKVRLLGRISDEDWAECYANADVFAMPNFHVENDVEGFGIVASEASLAGLIVVAGNVDGIPDAIHNEKNGYLLESLNSEAFINKFTDINNNRETYKIKAKEFARYTQEHFSWDTICDKYIEVLSKKD